MLPIGFEENDLNLITSFIDIYDSFEIDIIHNKIYLPKGGIKTYH